MSLIFAATRRDKVNSQGTRLQAYDAFSRSFHGPSFAFVYACLKTVHSIPREGLKMHEEHIVTGNLVLEGFRSFELEDMRSGEVSNVRVVLYVFFP